MLKQMHSKTNEKFKLTNCKEMLALWKNGIEREWTIGKRT
jgi:hypothetical protein